MSRALSAWLLVAALAHAQAEEVLLERVLSAKSSPSERIQFIDQMLQTDAGVEAVARGALDPTRDPEVVHAFLTTVERLESIGA